MGQLAKYLAVLVAFANYSYMIWEGVYAFLYGGFMRPESGVLTGKLGPWSSLFESAGINPESILSRCIFILWGLVGYFLAYRFAFEKKHSFIILVLYSFLSMWYMAIGTAASILCLIFLTAYIIAIKMAVDDQSENLNLQ